MSNDTTFPVRKLVNFTDDLARQISDYRFAERVASENEAIRQLIKMGLEVASERQARAAGRKGK